MMWMSRANGQVGAYRVTECGAMQLKCAGQEGVVCAGSWSRHK